MAAPTTCTTATGGTPRPARAVSSPWWTTGTFRGSSPEFPGISGAITRPPGTPRTTMARDDTIPGVAAATRFGTAIHQWYTTRAQRSGARAIYIEGARDPGWGCARLPAHARVSHRTNPLTGSAGAAARAACGRARRSVTRRVHACGVLPVLDGYSAGLPVR